MICFTFQNSYILIHIINYLLADIFTPIDKEIIFYEFNFTPHSSIGYSPFQLIFNYNPKHPTSLSTAPEHPYICDD